MSGHSKWATIKRAKEATDAKRSSTFSKLSKDIIIAARIGQSGDLDFNPMLRVSVNKAKSANMPADKIEKAIKKGLGIFSDGEQSYEKVYEAYTSGGVPILIDVETDNPNRTLTEVRTVIGKNGGKMVPEGSISWQFKELGVIKGRISIKDIEIDDLILEILSQDGIIDVEYKNEEKWVLVEIYTTRESLRSVNDLLKETYKEAFEVSEITIIKDNESRIELSDEQLEKLDTLIDLLKENEDVSNVWY